MYPQYLENSKFKLKSISAAFMWSMIKKKHFIRKIKSEQR